MRTRVWWLIGLMAALLGSGFAQTLVLTNGDVNGDNVVDDADLLSVLFAMGQSCPADCPEDLNGDGVVDDADLLTVLFNMGAQGAPEFAGQPNESPGGAFGISLTVRLADWVGSARQVKVQLKPVGTENDPDVPIFQYRASVGGTDTVVRLDNLPAGAYTVRAFAVASGRWLRTQGRIVTEVPWIFAAPTGANKVTVYWDGVPGATGYRVRWGTTSGSYPNSSAVLPATARQHTVVGLDSEREYYFVVEAAYDGLWGPPSEEDSAVPHEGAIPWDTLDPNQIIPAVRNLMEPPYGYLVVLSPEGLLYIEDELGNRQVKPAPYQYNPTAGQVEDRQGNIVAPLQRTGEDAESSTGPYRRVVTRGTGCIGAVVMFYIPPPAYIYSRFINVPSETNRDTRDTPYVYLGISYGDTDMEGGIGFHPAGRGIHKEGQEWSDPERRIPPPSYNRWQPYLKIARGNRLFPIGFEEIGVPKNHIRYENAPYGLIVRLRLIPDVRRAKGVEFRAKVWAAEFDDPNDYPRFICDFYGFADVKPPDRFRGAKTRRVISIAQIRPGSDGYRRTGSFFEFVGVGYQPLFSIGELPYSAYAYCPPSYQLWTGGISDPPTNFPPGGSVVNATVIEPYFQEYVHINLRR
jgi:hypothetical protein